MQGKTLRLTRGETVLVRSQWSAQCQKRGATVSSSAWETTAGALTGAALVSPLATVTLAEDGCGTLKNTVTLSNGETLVRYFRIEVEE